MATMPKDATKNNILAPDPVLFEVHVFLLLFDGCLCSIFALSRLPTPINGSNSLEKENFILLLY
jgi:hypothetical protein